MTITVELNTDEVIKSLRQKREAIEQAFKEGIKKGAPYLGGKMVEKVDSNISPALHPATVEQKGSSVALIDTGEMLGQITHQIEDNGLSAKVGVIGSRAFIAEVHEFGKDIEVTPKMRAYLHTIGIHLKSSTTHIHIPERSFIRSTFNTEKNKVEEIIKDEIKKAL